MLVDVNQQNVIVIEKIADSLVIDAACAVASENFDQRDGGYDDLDYAPLCRIEHGSAHRAAVFNDRFPVRAEELLALDVRYPRA
jgi:hypothetical protein